MGEKVVAEYKRQGIEKRNVLFRQPIIEASIPVDKTKEDLEWEVYDSFFHIIFYMTTQHYLVEFIIIIGSI